MKFEVKLNAKRNISFGALNRIVLLILPFMVKTVINSVLGAEYLGLNSLFSSILQVLSLSELGFSSAIVYHMYKPIAENDQRTINALLNLYRKAYFIIGTVVMGIGLGIIPFLPYLIKSDCPQNINIITIYIIQLANSSISYFLFGYKQSLLAAYQRQDIESIINLSVQASIQIAQILLLLLTKNYYFYIICIPVATVLENIWICLATKRMFPLAKCEGSLDRNILQDIKKLVAGTFIQGACSTTRNSLDSICISAFVSLTLTGIYNNYYYILYGLTLLLGIVSSSLAGGIGNHVAIKTKDENYSELEKLDFLYMGISGWATVCLFCIYQPFMELWMGEKMQLPFESVVLLCIYFYLLKMGDMRSLYSEANGLWWKMRYRSLGETVANIALNIGLGYLYGVNGIILATVLSLFTCNFLWSSSILFSNYFGKQKMKKYFLYHAKYAVFTIISCAVSYYLCIILSCENIVISIVVRGMVCTIIFCAGFFTIYRRKKIFNEAISMIKI